MKINALKIQDMIVLVGNIFEITYDMIKQHKQGRFHQNEDDCKLDIDFTQTFNKQFYF